MIEAGRYQLVADPGFIRYVRRKYGISWRTYKRVVAALGEAGRIRAERAVAEVSMWEAILREVFYGATPLSIFLRIPRWLVVFSRVTSARRRATRVLKWFRAVIRTEKGE